MLIIFNTYDCAIPLLQNTGNKPNEATPNLSPADDAVFDIKRVEIIDIHTRDEAIYLRRQSTDLTAILLAKRGYMPASPISPDLAVAFETLELFRLTRLRKPSMSTEAFAKVICDVYEVSTMFSHIFFYTTSHHSHSILTAGGIGLRLVIASTSIWRSIGLLMPVFSAPSVVTLRTGGS